ncbi:hypothetical protein D9758_017601 [Tetrapyrgos nigripes]|uniref:Novel STAND NTPase 1 domain-containing protein n=1 Tax=Tetrapyrgos nigripes TaxID=182062 RepID=A0A8H5C2N2_9AGAR|nr:hypothetical protein D9758_017601 [Tetrapyrgos nigripes]
MRQAFKKKIDELRNKPDTGSADTAIPSGFDLGHAKFALSAVANIAEGTGVTPLKATAQLAGEIVNVIQVMNKNKEDCLVIAKDITEFIEELQKISGKVQPTSDDGKELLEHVENFKKELQNVLGKLRGIKDRSNGKKLFHASADKDTIQECEKKIQSCIQKFDTRNILSMKVQLSEHLRDINARHDQTQRHTDATLDKIEEATPAIPRIFFGREDLVNEGAHCLATEEQTFLAILGPAGIGKTSLALHITKSQQVKKKFSRIYFLPCEILPDVPAIIFAMLQHLRLQPQQGHSQWEVLNAFFEANKQNVLFIFDNFETAWNTAGSRTNIKNFLEKLAEFSNISMIVTLRGHDGPGYINWHKLGGDSGISSLTLDAAKQIFSAICGKDKDKPEESKKLEDLLRKLDCVPLAVTLMAQRARTSPLDFLIKMWEKEGTSMLKEGRENSVVGWSSS